MKRYDDLVSSQDTITNYKQALETLVVMQDEDRLSLYTVLSVAVSYLNNHEITDVEVDKQKATINDILERYEIDSMKTLNEKVQECALNLSNNGLMRKKPLGGIQ